MSKYLKELIITFLVFPMYLYAQIPEKNKIDSLPSIAQDTLLKNVEVDTTISKKDKKIRKEAFTPDILHLKNGDRLTGKILSFQQGRLSFDAQGPGIVSIKWHKIYSIDGGSKIYKVESIYGEIFIGKITQSQIMGEIIVLTDSGEKIKSSETDGLSETAGSGETVAPKGTIIKFEDILRIFPLEEKWYEGFKGDIGAGVSYSKSSEVLRVSAESNLFYVISRWRFVNNFSYIATSTESSDYSVRIQENLQEFYSLHKKWVLYQANSFNRNDELGIDAKLSFGFGIGNNLVITERQRLLLFTGFLQNFEDTIETDKLVSNSEWPVTLQHSVYSFISPNLSSTFKLGSYVGITEKDRYRFDMSADLTWEIINNFKIQFTFYYNYDNKNIVGKSTKEDSGTELSLILELK
ncbi:hypothetical protein FLJC2902T_15840 [Flavobacterium limnosediminis JC2902]|uniref:DUF481 domain-containing protein n=1 Tax=Flavobacterium limnosediminis JC2902 TaxID=1341181 RepID=V6SPV1_9FLAO|nr:DUF481 domain-containing protein [Flavobacterium limnosediminis]ESU28237.1 hypothetical protein FLJC2902T_15840 [Flavobacterium limnosediminis JC2902]